MANERQIAGINGDIITVSDDGRRTFSKLKLYSTCVKYGYWKSVKSWLETADLWDAFVLAQDIAEDNTMFSDGLKEFKTKFGLADEQVESMLAECVSDDV